VRTPKLITQFIDSVFTNSTAKSESQATLPTYYENCVFRGIGNLEGRGINLDNAGSALVSGCTFDNLAWGIWTSHIQGGRELEVCESTFTNLIVGIAIPYDSVSIHGCQFVGLTDHALVSDGSVERLRISGCYFAPSPIAAVPSVEIAGLKNGVNADVYIHDSCFNAAAEKGPQLVITVESHISNALTVHITPQVLFFSPGQFKWTGPTESNADAKLVLELAPTTDAESCAAVSEVFACPGSYFAPPPPVLPIPSVPGNLVSLPPVATRVRATSAGGQGGDPIATSTPVDATSTPVDATSTPIVATSTPIDATVAPIVATSTPIVPTSTPIDATSTPIVATFAPIVPTSTPVLATSAPVDATSTPVDATSTPIVATSTPVVATSTAKPATANVTPPPAATQEIPAPTGTLDVVPAAPVPPAAPGGGAGQNEGNSDSGATIGAAVGGAVAAVLAAAAIAFIVFKKRSKQNVDELAEEDDSVDGPSTLPSSTELGEDNESQLGVFSSFRRSPKVAALSLDSSGPSI
jgi:hypothetical protein